jgi:pilus assembly protein CpaF
VHTRPLDDFARGPTLEILAATVDARCNILVSGATSSGKTTFLNSLAGLFAADERIVTLEDTAELRLGATHVVRLEARAATAEGVAGIGLDGLVRTALRLRPDRLVVGEVRGVEAFDMVQALNTGHDGSCATVHANGPLDAIRRVESMVWQAAPAWPADAVRDAVRHAVDVVVHVARSHDGSRRVAEVVEVCRPPAPSAVTVLVRDGQVVAPLTRRRVP